MSDCSSRPILSVDAAAKRLGMSRSKAYEWASSGALPGLFTVGQRKHVRCADLERWVQGDTPVSPDEHPHSSGLSLVQVLGR